MWYYRLKFAQIWNVSYSDRSLTEMIEALYELTYKYFMLKNPSYDFSGLPQRYDNIVKNIKSKAEVLIKSIADILHEVFAKWLQYHALLEPRTWATKRLEEFEDMDGNDYDTMSRFLQNVWIGEIRKIDNNEMIDAIDEGLRQNKMPYLQQAIESFKEALLAEDEELENQDYIKNMSFEEMFYTYFSDWENAMQTLDNYGNLQGIVIDIAAFYHFRLWYGIWKDKGIEDTRKRVENAYNMITQLKSMPFDKALAAINIIINTAHQTGGMTDYIVEKTEDNDKVLLQTLSRLSAQTDFTDWDNDLRSVGLKI